MFENSITIRFVNYLNHSYRSALKESFLVRILYKLGNALRVLYKNSYTRVSFHSLFNEKAILESFLFKAFRKSLYTIAALYLNIVKRVFNLGIENSNTIRSLLKIKISSVFKAKVFKGSMVIQMIEKFWNTED